MRRIRVLGVKSGAVSRKLRAVPRPPIEVVCNRPVIGRDQVGGFLQEPLQREDFAHRAAFDVAGGDADGVGGDRALGVGFQLDVQLAGFLVGGRREVEFCYYVGQGLAGHPGGEHPAADGVGQQIAHQRRQHLFQIVRTETNAAVVQRMPQRRHLRRPRLHLRAALPKQRFQQRELVVGQLAKPDLDLVAEFQLLPQIGQIGKCLDHGLDEASFDLHVHGVSPQPAARAATTGQPTSPAGSSCLSASSLRRASSGRS